ncbi:MAG TPA: LysM domain-containing protein [Anaerolineae bacterium]|nr:LysM domain-containing protein [Anaerolineae bacterium]
MNLTQLLLFVPLVAGLYLAYHLIVKQGLPSQNIGKIISYFVGLFIVFTAIVWMTTSLLPGWINDMLQGTVNSAEWQRVLTTSEGIFNDAIGRDDTTTTFSTNGTTAPTTNTNPNPGATNGNGTNNGGTTNGGTGTTINPNNSENAIRTGPIEYEVQPGDNLTSIAAKYGVTLQQLRAANSQIHGDWIVAGQVIYIPASQ